jgi:pimeloyl-ACP methyl ester carboxylesterase
LYITVNGARLFFDVIGAKLVTDGNRMRERPTVLLLHGGPGFDHSMFKPAFAALADVAQLVLLDHRGNGRSDHGDPALWTLDQWGDDVRAFCDTLGIEKPTVLGYSFGGLVAQSYAIRHPHHMAKLILYSTAPVLLDEPVLDAFETIGGAAAREVAARYFADRTERRRPSSGECVFRCTTRCRRIRDGWNGQLTIFWCRSIFLRVRASGSTFVRSFTAYNVRRWLSVAGRIRGAHRCSPACSRTASAPIFSVS